MGIGHDIDRVRVAVVTTSSAHRLLTQCNLSTGDIMNRPEKVIYTARSTPLVGGWLIAQR